VEINYFFEEINEFDIQQEEKTEWIKGCIDGYEKKAGDLNFIFCTDLYLLKINKEYLNHDYFTDIITFNYCDEDIISGDIFISVDRVEENAKEYDVSFSMELNRVIIHGVLHLIGLNDHTEGEKIEMREAENACLNRIISENI